MRTLQNTFFRVAEKVNYLGGDAFISFNPSDNFYLFRFESSFGISVVTKKGEAFFFTDGRYFEKAKKVAKTFLWKGWEEFLKKLKELKIEGVVVDLERIKASTLKKLKESFTLFETEEFLSEFRSVKSEEEIALISRAVTIAELSLKKVLHLLKPGITELEFKGELIRAFYELGADREAFDVIVAANLNSAVPHHKTSSEVIGEGAVVVDFGVKIKGYVSDITRTFLLGSVSRELKEIYDVVKSAQELGIASLKAGVPCKEIDRKVRDFISSKGYGEFFVHSTGHGIGIEVHEPPVLSKKSNAVLKKGMVVTVEPGIYVPQLGGVRIEDDCLVTEEGAFVLSSLPK